VQVSHSEGPANHTGPESCVGICEDAGEALTGERIGQPLSRESLKISGADVVAFTEGNMDGRVSASARPTRRGRRPWHVLMLCAREPGDLGFGRRMDTAGPHRKGEEP
jgi:hypothetical protein